MIHLDRRAFLRSSSLAAGTLMLHTRHTRAEQPAAPISKHTAFQKKLVGPILSMPTPFTSRFEVDQPAVGRIVKRGQEAGIGVFALTSGDGQYQWLQYDEIKALTRTLAEAVGGKGIMIAAAGNWWTQQCVDYARFAESVGADAVQILLPEVSDSDAIVEHFVAISRATSLPIVLHGSYAAALLEKLVKIDAVAAMKEDVSLDYYIDRERRFGERLAIFGGGTEHRFLVGHPYGSTAYYSAYAAFAPAESMRFWRTIQKSDSIAAYDWVKKYDHPFLDHWSQAFWHASLEYFGVAQHYLRPPVKSFTDEQMKEVKAFYDARGLRPAEKG